MSKVMADHATRERKAWIESVSPFHMYELSYKLHHEMAKLMSLLFGLRMPHECR